MLVIIYHVNVIETADLRLPDHTDYCVLTTRNLSVHMEPRNAALLEKDQDWGVVAYEINLPRAGFKPVCLLLCESFETSFSLCARIPTSPDTVLFR